MLNNLVTVIVPVYNVEKYLERCIRSICRQTYTNLEIILVDDGSTDQSGLIADQLAVLDDRIRVIHQENGGLSAARNTGIDHSTGEYLTFVDSDDWVTSDYVEHLLKILVENDADISMGNHLKVSDSNMGNISESNWNTSSYSSYQFLLKLLKYRTQENVQYTWAKIYKSFRDTDIRFPVGLIDEDVPTTFKLAANARKITQSNKPVYFYYENSESILRKKFNKSRFDLITDWEIVVKYAEGHCSEEITEYCKVNKYRSYLGLLCNIMLEDILESDQEYIENRESELVNEVRNHIVSLIKYPMPLSRKIIGIAVCINYPATKMAVKSLRKIRGKV